MRPLDQVIDATLILVPKTFPERDRLEKVLASLKEVYSSSTPEAERGLWFVFASEVNHSLGEPNTKWKKDVVNLLKGKKDYLEILNG